MSEELSNFGDLTPDNLRESATLWRTLSPALRRVATGLGLLYYTLALSILAWIALAVLFGILHRQLAHFPIIIVVWVVSFTQFILSFVGTLLCLAMPSESGGKNLIISSVVFMVIGTGITAWRWFFGSIPFGANLIGLPINMFSQLLFLLYLRKLAVYFRSAKLVARARNLIIAGTILAVTIQFSVSKLFAFSLNRTQGRESNIGILVITGLLFLILGFYILIKYLSLLRDLRTIIKSGLEWDNISASNAV